MGILSIFSRTPDKQNKTPVKVYPIENEHRIKVYYSYEINIESKLPEKDIRKHLAKECFELLEVCMNQEQFETERGEVIGHVNPRLEGEGTVTFRGPLNSIYSKKLNRVFLPKMVKIRKNEWKIIIEAEEDYSPIALINDLHSLVDLKLKLEQYLNIPDKQNGLVTPIVDFDKNKNPLYKEQRGIFTISCRVKDRIKLSKHHNKLDKDLFNGEGILEFIQGIRKDLPNGKICSNWIKEVDKILKKPLKD